MSAVVASLIAVAGTLLGASSTYWFQQRAAQRAEATARQERLRQDQLAACSEFAAAVDALEAAGVESLWLPGMVQAPCMSRRQPDGGLDWVRSVHGIRPTRLAAISVRSAGSQASTVSA